MKRTQHNKNSLRQKKIDKKKEEKKEEKKKVKGHYGADLIISHEGK